MNLQTILDAARALGPVLQAVPQIAALIDHAVDALAIDDQDEAKAELAKLRASNDALHDRLRSQLGAAAGR